MSAPDEPDTMAGELALGVLEGEERAAALRRMLSDPAFAREVEQWRTQFATLLDHVPDVAPSEGFERRIHAAVGSSGIGKWRAATGALALVAAALLAILIVRPANVAAPVPAPAQTIVAIAPLVAALGPAGKGATIAAAYDATSHEIRLSPLIDTPAAHAAELWAIGGDGVPHSLGLLDARNPTHLLIAASGTQRLTPGVALAISIEPAGGSPTGLPTGPVILSGKLLAT